MPFLHDVETKQLMIRSRAKPKEKKFSSRIFGSGRIFGPFRVGEVAKERKNGKLKKKTLSTPG